MTERSANLVDQLQETLRLAAVLFKQARAIHIGGYHGPLLQRDMEEWLNRPEVRAALDAAPPEAPKS